MGDPATLKECQFVVNHFNNAQLPREIEEINHRSHLTVQHMVKRYK
jgi:hypothetical protein